MPAHQSTRTPRNKSFYGKCIFLIKNCVFKLACRSFEVFLELGTGGVPPVVTLPRPQRSVRAAGERDADPHQRGPPRQEDNGRGWPSNVPPHGCSKALCASLSLADADVGMFVGKMAPRTARSGPGGPADRFPS